MIRLRGSGIGRKVPFKQLYYLYKRIKYFPKYHPYNKERVKFLTTHNINYNLSLTPANSAIDRLLIEKGTYEEKITEILLNQLKDDGIFVDIGANIGYYSVIAAKKATKGRVIAIEPVKSVYKALQKNIKSNNLNNVQTIRKGMGNKQEKATIVVDNNNLGCSSVVGRSFDSKNLENETIVIDTVDNILEEIEPTVIKIDVEGYELETIQGMKNIINESKPTIIFELSPCLYEENNVGMGKQKALTILNTLEKQGYRLWDINEGMIPVDKNKTVLKQQTNILARMK